jgi:hypothetical protein
MVAGTWTTQARGIERCVTDSREIGGMWPTGDHVATNVERVERLRAC